MRKIYNCVLLCILAEVFPSGASAGEIIAIKADRIDTVTSGVIQNGIIIIDDGRIKAIGNDIQIPETAKVIEATDKTIFPGLLNPATRVGLTRPSTDGPASNPQYRVIDELYPNQDQYKRVLKAGFTTIGLLPSDSSRSQGVTGQGAVIRPIGQNPEEMIITESGFVMIYFQASDKVEKIIKSALDSAKSKTDSTDPKVKPLIEALQGRVPILVRYCT